MFIKGFISSYPWAKNAYEYSIGQALPQASFDTSFDISSEISNLPYFDGSSTNAASSWNDLSYRYTSVLAGFYGAIDTFDSTLQSSYRTIDSQLNRLEFSVQKLETKLASLKVGSKVRKTRFDLTPYGSIAIESSHAIYETYPRLVEFGNSFILPTTGSHRVFYTSPNLTQQTVEFCSAYITDVKGDPLDSIDSNLSTSWSIITDCAAPAKINKQNLFWYRGDNSFGVAYQTTLRIPLPQKITTLKIDPDVLTGFYLSAIRWAPHLIPNIISNSTFASSSNWALNSAVIAASGYNNSSGAVIQSGGHIAQTLTVSSINNSSSLSCTGLAASGYYRGGRLEIKSRVKGFNSSARLSVTSLDASGVGIGEDFIDFYPNNSFAENAWVTYINTAAVSVVVKVIAISGLLIVDDVSGYYGEMCWDCERYIDGATVLQLPQPAFTHRLSFCLSQPTPQVVDAKTYRYMIGFREIDASVKEFNPRGALVSKPLSIQGELRQFWVNMQGDSLALSNLKCLFYPYADTTQNLINVGPSTYDKANNLSTDGELFEIITEEEYQQGYYNADPQVHQIILAPKLIEDVHNGTDYRGVLTLNYYPHFSKVRYNKASKFLTDYGINDYIFDPNTRILAGIQDQGIRNELRLTDFNSTSLEASSIITAEGYNPIQVTVETDNYIAYPDLLGTPIQNQINYIEGEVLTPIHVEIQTTNQDTIVLSFEQWAQTTTLRELANKGYLKLNEPFGGTYSLGWYGLPANLEPTLTVSSAILTYNLAPDKFRETYTLLKNNSQIPRTGSSSQETLVVSTRRNMYQTRHYPIINGKSGVFLNVYLDGVKLAPSLWAADPKLGRVELLTAEATNSTVVTADYYVMYKANEKRSLAKAINAGIVTRNITDYTYKSNPKFKVFDPNPLSENYYPVIEYYVSQDGELVFSKEMHKAGDNPAKIKVVYESLKLKPRLVLYAVRGLKHTTAIIDSIGLGYNATSHV